MAERLTQLQDSVNSQAENFCNSIGILQQFAQPSCFSEFDKSSRNQNVRASTEDYAQLFATLIAKTAREVDLLIDSLPSEESSPELQVSAASVTLPTSPDAPCRRCTCGSWRPRTRRQRRSWRRRCGVASASWRRSSPRCRTSLKPSCDCSVCRRTTPAEALLPFRFTPFLSLYS